MDDLAISGNSIHPEQTEIIMYQTEDGLTKIDVRMENETVWLTQAQMAELFQRERSGITKHIKNVFAEGEVDEKSNVKNVHIANSDKPVAYYSLDVIISVGYRVKSLRGTQFRIWANSVLKEYLIKGFAMNDELLKQAGGGNYFDELMDRIRDIRSSEKVFWRKVLDIYATSVDYDPRTEASVLFFKNRPEQNALGRSRSDGGRKDFLQRRQQQAQHGVALIFRKSSYPERCPRC